MSYLTQLVVDKVNELGGPEKSSEFFRCSAPFIREWVNGTSLPPLAAVEKVFSVDAFRGKSTEANWEGKQVAILQPFYREVNPLTHHSLMALLDRAKMAIIMKYGDAFIVHSRNWLADRFVQSGIPISFWADSDMVFPCGNAEWFNAVTGAEFTAEFAGKHTLNRLMESGKSIVGGLYCGRSKTRKPMFWSRDPGDYEIAKKGPIDLVKQVDGVATGALMVKREVYLDIQRKFPELAPQIAGDNWHYFSQTETELTKAAAESLAVLNDPKAPEAQRIKKAWGILAHATATVEATKRLRFGEDRTFALRAEQAGHPSHVDFGLVCGHEGPFVFLPGKA